MSTFAVTAEKIRIEPHENADALELARVRDYVAVVKKGEFSDGELAIYIPEAAILPDWLISDMGLEGMLAGGTIGPDEKKLRNRVKAVRLRGVLSQGLVWKPNGHLDRLGGEIEEGRDYAEVLGIEKWKPPIPMHMSGIAVAAPKLLSYTDIENIKNFPDVLVPGEEVVACEKLHGTCQVMCLVDDEVFISSKGHASSGRALQRELDAKGEVKNLYWRSAEQSGLIDKLHEIRERLGTRMIHLYGETLGVQDLNYGLQKGQFDFRAFDVRADQDFIDYDHFTELMSELEIPAVPELYRGPFDREKLEGVATGKETLTGSEAHVREGVVVRPVSERRDDALGRVILKVISPDYLLRKGDATEFE